MYFDTWLLCRFNFRAIALWLIKACFFRSIANKHIASLSSPSFRLDSRSTEKLTLYFDVTECMIRSAMSLVSLPLHFVIHFRYEITRFKPNEWMLLLSTRINSIALLGLEFLEVSVIQLVSCANLLNIELYPPFVFNTKKFDCINTANRSIVSNDTALLKSIKKTFD